MIVAAVALTVSSPGLPCRCRVLCSVPVAEDYLLTPKIVGRAVKVSCGGAPSSPSSSAPRGWGSSVCWSRSRIAAALQLLVQELLFPVLGRGLTRIIPESMTADCPGAQRRVGVLKPPKRDYAAAVHNFARMHATLLRFGRCDGQPITIDCSSNG